MNVHKSIIITFKDGINDKDFSMSIASNRYLANPNDTNNELVLSENEVSILENVLEIINEINDSMIECFEHDVIYSNEIKSKCIVEIEKYLLLLGDVEPEKTLIENVLIIFKDGVTRSKNIYFLF
jgi:hypothetical protein